MRHRLTARLEAVASQVVLGQPMADIGTDHAKLPLALLRRNTVPSAIAMDVAEGPLKVATKAAEAWPDRLVVRRSDGLAALMPNEVATICICGMGGRTMADILERGRATWTNATRLVLQPQGVPEAVRMVMTHWGWDCVSGQVVEDRGKLFTVEAWEKVSSPTAWGPLDLKWGRCIRLEPHPLFGKWLEMELAEVSYALDRMAQSNALSHSDAAVAKEEQDVILQEMNRIG